MAVATHREEVAQADLALARSAAYRVLSQAFVYPTKDAVAALRGTDLPLARALGTPLGEEVGTLLEEVAATLRGVSYRRLEVDYRDLFSHLHSVDCPPYETDYAAFHVFRRSQELADLAGFYRAFGMAAGDEERELPDHVSVELEFMHLATYKEAWGRATGDAQASAICVEAERAFLRDHLGRWLGEFTRRVAVVGRTTPYAIVARLGGSFLAAELDRLGVVVPGSGGEGEAIPEPEAPALCEGEP